MTSSRTLNAELGSRRIDKLEIRTNSGIAGSPARCTPTHSSSNSQRRQLEQLRK